MQKNKVRLLLLLLGALPLACSEGKQESPKPAAPPPEGLQSGELLYTDGILLEVVAWGPRATRQGQLFNRQADGSSAFWIESRNKRQGVDYALWLDDLPLHTNNPANSPLITGSLTEDQAQKVVANPGIRTLSLLEPKQRLRQIVGEFLIE